MTVISAASRARPSRVGYVNDGYMKKFDDLPYAGAATARSTIAARPKRFR
jgi:hypothetical protein